MNTKQGRDKLKTYFETGDRPTEDEFSEFIDSGINQLDDNVHAVKQSNGITNIGIGTDAPDARLEVNGNVNVTGHVFGKKAAGTEDFLMVSNSAEIQLFGSQHTNRKGDVFLIGDHRHGAGSGKISFDQRISDTQWRNNLLIDANGNVGIGTTTPGNKLEIVPGSGSNLHTGLKLSHGAGVDKLLVSDANGNARWEQPTNLTNGFWTKNGNHILNTNIGNVGIGTSSPGNKLEIAVTGANTGLKLTNGAGVDKLLISDAQGNAIWKSPTSITDSFWKKSGNNIVNGNPGNVIVGQSNQNANLGVFGNVSINDKTLMLRDGNDMFHGLGYYAFAVNKPFASENIDGPVLFGHFGGALGAKIYTSATTPPDEKIAMRWFHDQSVDFKGNVKVRGYSPFLIERLLSKELSGGFNLGKDTSVYGAAVVVGFKTTRTNTKANDLGIFAYTYLVNGVWHVKADMESESNHEKWDVTIMYIVKEMVSWTPAPTQ